MLSLKTDILGVCLYGFSLTFQMVSMDKIFLPFLVPGLVAACHAPPFSPDSPLTPVPVESRLVLNRPLHIPPGTVSLWFQKGKQMPPNNLDRYYPHCKFETLQMQDSEKTVEPDTFVIHKVVRWEDYAMQPVQLASSRISAGIGGHINGGAPGPINTATEMFLRSERQPDVYRLICSQWEDPSEANHVTINQIRLALGDTFSLQLPVQQENKQTAVQ